MSQSDARLTVKAKVNRLPWLRAIVSLERLTLNIHPHVCHECKGGKDCAAIRATRLDNRKHERELAELEAAEGSDPHA